MPEALNIRYQGNIVSIPNNAEFNPDVYGQSKINIRLNSQSTMRLGLTTNTEAQSYCKMKFRVKSQECYVGRVSSVSYISGEPVDYKGSVSVSRSESVSTSMYTNGAGSGSFTSGGAIAKQTKTNNTGSTVTTNTALATGMYTNGAGSGSFTSGGAIAKNTATNNTGSTVTTNTAQATASGTNNYGTGTRSETVNKTMASRTWNTTVVNNTGSTVSHCSWMGGPGAYAKTTIHYSWSSSRKYTNTTYKGSWTSCRKNTASTYKGSWTSCSKYSQSTSSITETCHNFNI